MHAQVLGSFLVRFGVPLGVLGVKLVSMSFFFKNICQHLFFNSSLGSLINLIVQRADRQAGLQSAEGPWVDE